MQHTGGEQNSKEAAMQAKWGVLGLRWWLRLGARSV